MSTSKPEFFRLVPSLILSCPLAYFSSLALADPPIVLPPMTVYGVSYGGPEVLCTGMDCSDIMGTVISQALFQAVHDEIGQEDITVELPVQDIADNPYNQETGVTCNSPEEIRSSHAKQDLGPYLPSLNLLDAVRINYEQGDSEIGVIQCRYCTVPVVLIESTCG